MGWDDLNIWLKIGLGTDCETDTPKARQMPFLNILVTLLSLRPPAWPRMSGWHGSFPHWGLWWSLLSVTSPVHRAWYKSWAQDILIKLKCSHQYEIPGLWLDLLRQWEMTLRQGPTTLCCSAAMLAPGHTSLQATEYKETVWDKNNCVHVQVRQILDKKIQKTKKLNCHFWRAGSKSRVLCMPPAHNTT